jgi:hypothetical protein
MRPLPMLLLLGILRVAVAQTGSPPVQRQSLFTTLVPDATITVTKHPMGADMIEMSFTANGYPPELAKEQIRKLGVSLNSDPRGVQAGDYVVEGGNPSMHFTKAMFAVDGVIDRQKGAMRLNPFAKAFAGAPKPWTIPSLDLVFQNETPTTTTLKRWEGKGVLVQGRFQDSKDQVLKGIEYRIQLISQDPAKMDIPEPGDKAVAAVTKAARAPGTDWTTIAVFLIAAGAVGALVYSLLLRGRPAARI